MANNAGASIRVLIVDDFAETRENIRKLLQFESDIEVVAVARNRDSDLTTIGHFVGLSPTVCGNARRRCAELLFRRIYSTSANFIEQVMESKRTRESEFRARQNQSRALEDPPLLRNGVGGNSKDYK